MSEVGGFIIGPQKAGSTSLDRYLGAHHGGDRDRAEVPAPGGSGLCRGAAKELRSWVRDQRAQGAGGRWFFVLAQR